MNGTKHKADDEINTDTKRAKVDTTNITLPIAIELLRLPDLFFSLISSDVRDYVLKFLYTQRGLVKSPSLLHYDRDELPLGTFVNPFTARHFRITPRGGFLTIVWPHTILRLANDRTEERITLTHFILPNEVLETRSGHIFGINGHYVEINSENQRWFGGGVRAIAVNLAETRLYKIVDSGRFCEICELPYNTEKIVCRFEIYDFTDSLAVLSDDTILVTTCFADGCICHYALDGELLSTLTICIGPSYISNIVVDAADVVFFYCYSTGTICSSRPPYSRIERVASEHWAKNGVARFLAVNLDGSLILAEGTGQMHRYVC
jgi:hypothetical protein